MAGPGAFSFWYWHDNILKTKKYKIYVFQLTNIHYYTAFLLITQNQLNGFIKFQICRRKLLAVFFVPLIYIILRHISSTFPRRMLTIHYKNSRIKKIFLFIEHLFYL